MSECFYHIRWLYFKTERIVMISSIQLRQDSNPIDSCSKDVPSNKIAFRATTSSKLERVPSEDNFDKQGGIGTGAKVGLATLALLGLGVAADFAFAQGKHVKNLLGIAKKEGKKTVDEAIPAETKEEVKKTFKELYDDAIKNKEKSVKNEITGRTHSFKYDKDGNLVEEIVTKGEDKAVIHYYDSGRKSKLVDLKKNGNYYSSERAKLIKHARTNFNFKDVHGNSYSVRNGKISDEVLNSEGVVFKLSEQPKDFQAFVQREFKAQEKNQINNAIKRYDDECTEKGLRFLEEQESAKASAIKESNQRNEEWLNSQNTLKKQEYVEFWDNALKKQELEQKISNYIGGTGVNKELIVDDCKVIFENGKLNKILDKQGKELDMSNKQS